MLTNNQNQHVILKKELIPVVFLTRIALVVNKSSFFEITIKNLIPLATPFIKFAFVMRWALLSAKTVTVTL